MTESTPWQDIIAYWSRLRLPIRPGVRAEDIAEFEAKHQVVLPADLRAYFQAIDGTGMYHSDEHLTSFLSLAELKPVHEWLDDAEGVIYPGRFAYPNCFIFADHCCSCWMYAVRITADPADPAPVFLVSGGLPVQIETPSFREFMTKYAHDPGSLL